MDTITIKVEDLGKVSDGYHTIGELYEHRCLLFLYLCLQVRSKFESNETAPVFWKEDVNTNGWFLLYLITQYGQISYHLPNKFKYLDNEVLEKKQDAVWDGHKPSDVIDRLLDSSGQLMSEIYKRGKKGVGE